jgi:hypothetical protein
MKEINRIEQNYELNINKENEYLNQLNQIKLTLSNRLHLPHSKQSTARNLIFTRLFNLRD